MVIVDCIVLHYMHIWHLRILASSLQFRERKINMALARMDKLVKKLMSNPAVFKSWQLKMDKHCQKTAGIVTAVCHISSCSALNLL